MQILKSFKLGIAFFVLYLMTFSQASAEDITKQTQRDGLEFTVVYPNEFSSTGPFVVTCQLKNITQQTIPYELTTRSLGFSLSLTDKQNRDIPPNAAWAKWYIPNSFGMGSHMSMQLEPRKSLIFKVNLYEAFGSRASEGSKLTVKWNPGEDGCGNPLTLGRGLEISFALPTLETSVPIQNHNVDTTASAVSSATPLFTPLPPPAAEPSSMPAVEAK